ncbi:phosphatidylglycerol/phosphatidylinositol transfer protein precursor [Lineolata rhizophorae]|uniref:Phosphatidylglycerol/phosphatidylinositol transfer protein n=1 Tax=Lineolata rhizophorae TaxID=578093 RepID=A0A6A6NQR0_9PEZI|nr:phosphatidylglycerol/phosphatidylinositol transfer protein precursor [Lineolata rhizophorae]
MWLPSTKLAILLVASTCTTAARSTWLGASDQVSLTEDLSVPGDNPLFYCSAPDDDILEIDHVDLSPNPPEAGKTLVISAKGTLSEPIEEGAKVHLQVKYGLITLINQEADLCDQVKNVDLECPLEKGETTLTKEVNLPNEIPPGKYTVLADVFTKDGDKITCLTATVAFHR